jgi:DNA-binding NarL/FixJ family response regulator
MFAEMLDLEKINVLLVEDSRNEAMITQRQLHAIDDEFAIHRVTKLGDAMTYITRENIGVVILDLGLPDSNGPESIQTLSQKFPELPIVVLSGRNDEDTVRRALEYGAQEFLNKGECSGNMIRQALLSAMIRKSLKTSIYTEK